MQSLQLVRVLVESGRYDLTLLCYFEFDTQVVAEFEACGAKVRLLNLNRSVGPAHLVRRLLAGFHSLKPNMVHVQYMAPGLLPIIAARLAGCRKVLATVHQPWTPTNHGWQAQWMLRFGASLCTQFICVSEAAERSWFGSSSLYTAESGASRQPRHCTIHNAVDVGRIDDILQRTSRPELRKRLGFGNEPVIGVVSRLTREKGIDILLDAMPLVLRQVPHARLLIVGDGAERPALEAQARSLGLSQTLWPSPIHSTLNHRSAAAPAKEDQPSSTRPPSTILWAGKQPWDRGIELMGAMDVVAVPSRFEGFGLTGAEAMACRRPVIASDVEALAEVVGSAGAGVLFKAGEAADLASKIRALSQDKQLRAGMGQNGRKRVAALFSAELFRARTLSLYHKLLSTG